MFLFQMIEGCFNKLLQLIEENAVIIAAVALGIAALEVKKSTSVQGHRRSQTGIRAKDLKSCDPFSVCCLAYIVMGRLQEGTQMQAGVGKLKITLITKSVWISRKKHKRAKAKSRVKDRETQLTEP